MEDIADQAPLAAALEDMPMHAVTDIACSHEYTRIAIVRNPFSRLLSKFVDKVIVHAEELLRHGSPMPYNLTDGQNFSRFVQRPVETQQRREPEAFHVNGHFRRQSNFCGLRQIPYSILHMEELHHEAPRLARMLGVDGAPAVRAALERLRPHNKCADALRVRQYYDPPTIARVRAYFAEDFERFGYSTHMPSVEHLCSHAMPTTDRRAHHEQQQLEPQHRARRSR